MAKYLKKYKTGEAFENDKTSLIHDMPKLKRVIGLVNDIKKIKVIKDDDRLIHAVYEFPNDIPEGSNPFFSGDSSDIKRLIVDGKEIPLDSIGEFSLSKGIHKVVFELKDNINDPDHDQFSYSFGFIDCIYLIHISLGTLIRHLDSQSTSFKGCFNLESVEFTPSFTSLNGGEGLASIFKDCRKLKDFINWPKSLVYGLTWYSLQDTLWYNSLPEDNRAIYFNNLFYGFRARRWKEYELTVLEGTIGICGFSFEYDSYLTKIELPDGLESIGRYAFSGTNKLKAINIPKTVHEIGQGAFSNSSMSGIIDLSKNLGLKTLENDAFVMSGIQGIYLPKSLISIGARCFDYCTSCKTIICKSHKAPSVRPSTFNDSDNLYYRYTGRKTYNTGENKLYVPKGSTGYDTGVWKDILLNPSRCGFTLVELDEDELDNLINQQ